MINLQTSVYQPKKEYLLKNNIYKTKIRGLFYLKSELIKDKRGFYQELALFPDLEQVLGYAYQPQQINYSRSGANTIRGFHAEKWSKWIKVTLGVAYCVIADIRTNSETFGFKEVFLLGDGQNCLPGSIFVDQGLANSFCVIKGPVDYFYSIDGLHRDKNPMYDQAVSLFDSDLDVEWPVDRKKMILSKRDEGGLTLRELFPEKF